MIVDSFRPTHAAIFIIHYYYPVSFFFSFLQSFPRHPHTHTTLRNDYQHQSLFSIQTFHLHFLNVPYCTIYSTGVMRSMMGFKMLYLIFVWIINTLSEVIYTKFKTRQNECWNFIIKFSCQKENAFGKCLLRCIKPLKRKLTLANCLCRLCIFHENQSEIFVIDN